MELSVDQLITLENGKKYVITNETQYESNKYFLVAGVLDDESDINNDFQVVKEIKENENSFVEQITDKELINKLLILFNVKEEQ